jgi:hypothetical protein
MARSRRGGDAATGTASAVCSSSPESFALQSASGPPPPPGRTPSRLSGERVKANLALALPSRLSASLLLAAARSQTVFGRIIVSGTTTISNVKVGTLIKCKSGPAVRVPRWFGGSALSVPGKPGEIALTHRHNGSVTIFCRL